MEQVTNYINPELLILVPVLYFIGMALKNSKTKDELIPFILGLISVILCVLWVVGTNNIQNYKDVVMAIFTALVQGVLIAGASVYSNQLIKQASK